MLGCCSIALRDRCGESLSIDRERGARGYPMFIGRPHDQRTEGTHFLMKQANGIMLGIVRAEAVRADHFGQRVELMCGGRIAPICAAHFAQADAKPRFGELPRGFGPGQAAADDVDVEGHGGHLPISRSFVMPAFECG